MNLKVLVLGAGAVGGYFGGRLLEKGADVTFLVRENRQKQLAEHGLMIRSVHGDVHLQPRTILSGESSPSYDIIFLSTKAYHLDGAIESLKPYVREQTLIIPLLNGYAHIERLQQTFGREKVLGGLCFIESTLNDKGEVVQTSPAHELVYGEWSGSRTLRIQALEELFQGAKADFTLSENIIRDVWHKYLFITTMSGMTTLINAPVGPIREAEYGQQLIRQLFEEVAAVMRAEGAPLADDIVDQQMHTFNKMTYGMKSSMLRDMEKGSAIEADHLQGYLLQLAEKHQLDVPLLQVVYHKLKVYELELKTQSTN